MKLPFRRQPPSSPSLTPGVPTTTRPPQYNNLPRFDHVADEKRKVVWDMVGEVIVHLVMLPIVVAAVLYFAIRCR